MAATKKELKQWFIEGKKRRCNWMLIICDTFDYDDYPAYFRTVKSLEKTFYNAGEMQRVMEVYDLNKDMNTQLEDMDRAWELPF